MSFSTPVFFGTGRGPVSNLLNRSLLRHSVSLWLKFLNFVQKLRCLFFICSVIQIANKSFMLVENGKDLYFFIQPAFESDFY